MNSASDGLMIDLPAPVAAEVADLARRMRRANGPAMRLLNQVGGTVEDQLRRLPDGLREGLGRTAVSVLTQVYSAAARVGALKAVPRTSSRLHKLAAMASGAAGGAAGLASAVVELPATVGLIFAAMQKVAGEEGFDPASEEVRLICLEVLGSGGPGRADDGIDTAFFGARLGLSGSAIQAVIARVAPHFATLMGQKLASQTVPVIGAVAGAGVNYVFMEYFQEMARVRFALLRLARNHGEEAVKAGFRAEMARAVPLPDADAGGRSG